ncbi:MAG: hypothetical protein M1831_004732 [Alyxoria varia]|nr:MAG: hypothetical protein M1831_004732 [Alyxoria varia]
MSSSQAARQPGAPASMSLKQRYLILYNACSLLLWTSLLARVLIILLLGGLHHIYPSSGTFVRGVQTLALVEVLHSALGLVRAPILTTVMQVASRLLLVWGVVSIFGDVLLVGGDVRKKAIWGKGSLVRDRELQKLAKEQQEYLGPNQVAYFGMLVAWSVTEVVRYGYFTFFLASGSNLQNVPRKLIWARYNFFYVLYPLGISCEWYLVYKALPLAQNLNVFYGWFLTAALFIYIPGSYILYSHMMAQRRRVAKGKQKQGME